MKNEERRALTGEQRARDMLETMGVEDAQSWSAGDVVELAELIRERDHLRATLDCLTDEPSGEPLVVVATREMNDALAEIRCRLEALERHLHRDPEPPDSTEPEDDVVERVAIWLKQYDRPGPIRVGTYHDRARRLLHDTGILTTESETP